MYLKFYNSTHFENTRNFPTTFLAGPTERNSNHTAWRKELIAYIAKSKYKEKFDDTVFIIPEFCTLEMNDNLDLIDYPDGIISLSDFENVDRSNIYSNFPRERIYKWERNNLANCDIIVFWVDRNIKEGRPALTTNIEFGNFYHTGKCICGSPKNADKVDYMRYVWEKEVGEKWYSSFNGIVKKVVERLA